MQESLKAYYDLLSRWNKSIKLVSSAESFDRFAIEHIADVLRLRSHIEGACTLLDLGTGAGIPGILIKMDMPGIRVVLLDSVRKKISFCNEAIRQLALADIQAFEGRAEAEETIRELGHFEVIVSRATWKLADYVNMSAPYMKDRGSKVIALKGSEWRLELSKAKEILRARSLELLDADEYRLEDGRQRCILVLGN